MVKINTVLHKKINLRTIYIVIFLMLKVHILRSKGDLFVKKINLYFKKLTTGTVRRNEKKTWEPKSSVDLWKTVTKTKPKLIFMTYNTL